MNGSVWGLFATAIGVGVGLAVAVPKALPSNAAGSTNNVAGVLSQVSPLLGLLLLLAAIGALIQLTL